MVGSYSFYFVIFYWADTVFGEVVQVVNIGDVKIRYLFIGTTCNADVYTVLADAIYLERGCFGMFFVKVVDTAAKLMNKGVEAL